MTNRESLIQIGIGAVDIALGVGLVGTAGGAPPGLLLIAVGADQVYTGIANILTGQKNRSLFEEAGYNLTLKLGFSEETAGVVGQLTPGLMSLGAGIWGGLATSAARTAGRRQPVIRSFKTSSSIIDAPRPLPSPLPNYVKFFVPDSNDAAFLSLRGRGLKPNTRGVWVLEDEQIYLDGTFWKNARLGQQSRVFWEEQGHRLRDLARTQKQQLRMSVRYEREGIFKFVEEFRASQYSGITRGQSWSYASDYLRWRGVGIDLLDIGWSTGTIPIGSILLYLCLR